MEVKEYSLMHLIQGVQLVAKSGDVWRKLSDKKRRELFADFSEGLAASRDVSAQMICEQKGYAPWAADEETLRSVELLSRWHKEDVGPLGLPHGKVLVMLSGGSAFYKMAAHIAAALLTGNFLFLRVPTCCEPLAQFFAKLLTEAQVPLGAVQFFVGDDHPLDLDALSHPALQVVFYEGQSANALAVRKECLASEKLCLIQVESRNPLILGRNLDMSLVGEELVKVLFSTDLFSEYRGNRVFVPENQWDDVIEKLQTLVKDQMNSGFMVDMGKSNSLAAHLDSQKNFENAGLMVNSVVDEQGPVFVPEVTNCSKFQHVLLPGPAITLTRYKNSAEAIKFCNTTPWGHCAYVFENDLEKAKKWGRQLHFGQVFCNQFVKSPYSESLLRQGFASGTSYKGSLLALYQRSQGLLTSLT